MRKITADGFAEAEDLESVLDDCMALSMPMRQLQVHYRSAHESLIAFSNVNFYGGKLTTFPSADDQQRRVTLEMAGGERRLNVAVTRARQRMMVFSSLEPEQIDLSRTSSEGVMALRRFLEYARNGQLPIPSSQITARETDTITRDIARRLHTYACLRCFRSMVLYEFIIFYEYKNNEIDKRTT